MRIGMVIAASLFAVANTGIAQVAAKTTARTIGICQIVDNTPGWLAGEVRNPLVVDDTAIAYIFRATHIDLSSAARSVTLIKAPQYGNLKPLAGTANGYEYIPSTPTYAGKDSASFLVEIGGYKVEVQYGFHVLTSKVGDGPEFDRKICGPKGTMWKISLAATTDNPEQTRILQA